ncbi:MAG: polysaccharide deacetylase family protein [Burkholderiales bacterium]
MSGQPASGWSRLDRELDAWHAGGRPATLWLRDDDACRDSAALRRLLDVAEANTVPVALAVIPALLEASLPAAVAPYTQATVIQHGYAHRNHAPADARSCELGANRPVFATLDELAAGFNTLAHAFGERFVAVLVPPWNRIDAGITARLPVAGYCGLSTFGLRKAPYAVRGLPQCNTHVDLIAWRKDRAFIGADEAIDRTVAHLRARRQGDADVSEPTGILTHHVDLDPAAWGFLEALVTRTRAHAGARWIDVRSAFAAHGRSAMVASPATSAVTSARSA